MDGLTEGRMVHYVAQNGQHLAAVVTRLWGDNGAVNLNVQVPGDGENGNSPARAAEDVGDVQRRPQALHVALD